MKRKLKRALLVIFTVSSICNINPKIYATNDMAEDIENKISQEIKNEIANNESSITQNEINNNEINNQGTNVIEDNEILNETANTIIQTKKRSRYFK